MNQLIKTLRGVAALVDSIAQAGLPGVDPALAKEVHRDIDALEALFENADGNRIAEWIKHHGNLPGTPASRGEMTDADGQGKQVNT